VERIRAVLARERDDTTDIVFSGGPVYAAELERYSQRMVNARLGGTFTLLLLVDGGDPDALKRPDILGAMAATQRFLDGQPHVGKTLSLADFVRRMNLAMHADDPAHYRVPDSRTLIAQYLLLYSMSGEPTDFDIYVDSTYRAANIRVFLDTDSSTNFRDLVAALQGFSPTQPWRGVRIQVGGEVADNAALSTVVARGKILNIVQIGVVILVITSMVFRSLLAGLFVLTPLILAALANFGLMGWAGIPLNIGTSVISAMAVGVGADYAIYLIYRLKEDCARGLDELGAVRHTLTTAGQAILFVALAIAGGYGVLLLSYQFLFYMWFGILIANTMLVSCLAALTVLPSLILVLRPRFVFDVGRSTAVTR
jgi:predicted RND superfamily exporter protein